MEIKKRITLTRNLKDLSFKKVPGQWIFHDFSFKKCINVK